MSSNFANAFYANPFLAQKPVSEVPAMPRERIEPGDKLAMAIEVLWGDQPLHVAHVPLTDAKGAKAARAVFVGDASEGAVDVELPMPRTCIARVEGDAVHANGELVPPGGRAEWRHEAFSFRVAVVAAAKPLEKGRGRSRVALAFWLGSAAVHAAVHAAIVGALVMSPGGSLDDDSAGLDKSTQAYMLQVNKNHADREIAEQDSQANAPTDSSKPGGSGKQHAGDTGQMGDLSHKATNAHYEIQGPADTKEVKMAKVRALIESNSYGAIGALASVFGSTANTPVSFDSESMTSLGRDQHNFMGNLTGAYGGDAFGYNGLGSFGTAAGGGGIFDGVGLGTIGDFGHSGGSGDGLEWGSGKNGKGLARKPLTPVHIIDTNVDTIGKLPPDAIKRVIRANFPRFRQCYETGLKKDPGLKGTIVTRFIIDTTGATESVSPSGGSMSDSGVSGCVLGVYKTLSFPEPESGKVMVTYPIDFQNE